MDSQASPTPAVLRLPNEILSAIFTLRAKANSEHVSPNAEICSIRLTCRRFCELSTPLIVRRTTVVDYSQPDTLARLRTVVNNPILAAGIGEVNVRLHFYHPWVAETFENFMESLLSEWEQKRQSWWIPECRTRGEVAFRAVIYSFIGDLIKEMESARKQQDRYAEAVEEVCLTDDDEPSRKVIWEAYRVYKKMYEAQRLFDNGQFETTLAETLSKMPNLRAVTLHDRDLNHNHDPDKGMDEVDEDVKAQEDRLFKLFSRPMIWEDARWIRPHDKIWPGVPINLLMNIPLAIGNAAVIVANLSIYLSAAPDYTRLEVDPERLGQLTAAVKVMEVFQFTFQPRCRSNCGPWELDHEGLPEYVTRELDEWRRINQFLGAFLAAKCMYSVNINLGEFWYGSGVNSMSTVGSLGADFAWPVASELSSVTLVRVCLASEKLGVVAKSMIAGGEFELHEVYLSQGTWRDALDALREGLQSPRGVRIMLPLGGGAYTMGEDLRSFAFGRDEPDFLDFPDLPDSSYLPLRSSRAERFIAGEDIPNPLAT
ncbi:hypothetical protein EDB81DRAFT_799389 [Dactylonectria macrodidyma]|uniref:F-box domain-containing protein n=1 Tax=Dactylonectria macrodidyma TaxID=307937 RepID=A0A9P9ENW7_9HYPO|nr:hypothetical protein EDB81DRAFT_799389 [Dactylonectria macrodidyma]